MTSLKSAMRLSLVVGLVALALALLTRSGEAAPMPGPAGLAQGRSDIVQVRSKLREFFESLTSDDDDDAFVHDNHYERPWNDLSRKEKVRAYQQFQWDAQVEDAKRLKQKQKELIKRQRGW